jgi:hypothetical protein
MIDIFDALFSRYFHFTFRYSFIRHDISISADILMRRHASFSIARYSFLRLLLIDRHREAATRQITPRRHTPLPATPRRHCRH